MKPATVVPEAAATSSPRPTTAPTEPPRPSAASTGPALTPAPPAESSRPFGVINSETAKAFAAAATTETRAFARPEPGVQPQRVLLVDDSRSIRTLLKIYLMARSFEYIEAESAEAGLKVLETQPVDLILTDFHMDGMNGADFAATVRASRDVKVAKIPILMMTGDANAAEVRNKGQKAGINAFVRKPVSCAQLMTLVDTILPTPKKG
ncbi:response regulator receiver domain-containing protein [Archangium gephyra]|uniref:Response regulator receiver domain-containing protein n=1 Tax=Archangium gephyra TaxID=48 RepID=A0ABX9JSV7_9BACT|nr:response regulator receiver domain-containing protein [Archangium gephyra]